LVLAAVLAVLAAAPRRAGAAPNAPAAQAGEIRERAAANDLRVDITVKYEKGGASGVLAPGGVLTNDDNYRVIFKASRDSYVYVYQIDASQRLDPIFPNPKYTPAANPVTTKL